jgi:hypothetical protein
MDVVKANLQFFERKNAYFYHFDIHRYGRIRIQIRVM